MSNVGEINGSSFSSSLSVSLTGNCIRVNGMGGEGFDITHDMIKYAALIALGPISVSKRNSTTVIYGAKYRFELIDGRTGVLTCSTEATGMVEHILF
jgi:hypothetical protein